jgi:uncharacterized membrane protein HdeD (DUF308 family)
MTMQTETETRPPEGGATGAVPIAAPESVRRNWGWIALLGALLIAGGVVAIAMPVVAGIAATLVIGVSILIGGIVQGVHAFRVEGWKARAWNAVSAIVYVVGGLLLLFQPIVGTVALSLLIIAILIVDGFARIMMGVRMKPERGWGWLAASGALSAAIGVGIWLFALPAASLTLLGAFFGASLIVEGACFLYLAFAARPASDRTVTPDAA